MTIVSIRGTNGAGKSHLVRSVVCHYARFVNLTAPGRRRPVGRVWRRAGPGAALFVPGHYDIANGGLDTLSSLDEAYSMIRQYGTPDCDGPLDTLYEGKNLSDGPGRLLELKREGYDCHAVLLDVPFPLCVASVRARGHRIQEKTIAKLHVKSKRDCDKLGQAGVHVLVFDDREAALRGVLDLLEIN